MQWQAPTRHGEKLIASLFRGQRTIGYSEPGTLQRDPGRVIYSRPTEQEPEDERERRTR